MSYYGWCPHRKDLMETQACIPCSEKSRLQQEEARRDHGKDCMCFVCDRDNYWRNLGKQ